MPFLAIPQMVNAGREKLEIDYHWKGSIDELEYDLVSLEELCYLV